jgi:hypothetical protein
VSARPGEPAWRDICLAGSHHLVPCPRGYLAAEICRRHHRLPADNRRTLTQCGYRRRNFSWREARGRRCRWSGRASGIVADAGEVVAAVGDSLPGLRDRQLHTVDQRRGRPSRGCGGVGGVGQVIGIGLLTLDRGLGAVPGRKIAIVGRVAAVVRGIVTVLGCARRSRAAARRSVRARWISRRISSRKLAMAARWRAARRRCSWA